MTDIQFHEAANIFPLDDEHLDELAADIRAHGQQVPIQLLGGQILDGRRRYMACRIAGVKPVTVVVDVADPVAHVMSLNLHRRHLNESQRGLAGARAKEVYAKQAKERQKATLKKGNETPVVENLPEREKGRARDQAGAALNVSGKTIDFGSVVLKKGDPELVKAVDSGKVAISTAAKVAQLPPDRQRKAVSGGKEAIRQAVAELEGVPTPQQEAASDPGRRWCVALHKLYVLTTSVRDNGGIVKLAKGWKPDDRKQYAQELRRLVGELQKWISVVEGKA